MFLWWPRMKKERALGKSNRLNPTESEEWEMCKNERDKSDSRLPESCWHQAHGLSPQYLPLSQTAGFKETLHCYGHRLNLASVWCFTTELWNQESRCLGCSNRKQKLRQMNQDSSTQLTWMLWEGRQASTKRWYSGVYLKIQPEKKS